MAIAKLKNYSNNCFEIFLYKTSFVIFILIEKIKTCFFKMCIIENRYLIKKKPNNKFLLCAPEILKFTLYIISGDKRKPLPILRGLNYKEEEEKVMSENIPAQNLGGPRAVKAEDTSDVTPVIAGSVLGAVVLIGIVVVLLFIYFKRRYT